MPVSATRRRALTTLTATLATTLVTPRLARAAEGAAPRPRPLRQAHAHNDYLHPRPLRDALAQGFTSVEADVFLVGGDLLVAHTPAELDPTRTLRSLYLDPLLDRVRSHQGSVYPGWRGSLQLLVDIKADGVECYRELDRQLRSYREMLSGYARGRVRRRAVTPVVSGDRAARGPLAAQGHRYAFYDGRLDDLGGGAPASLIPLVSANWTQTFGWRGVGPMPPVERERLRALVGQAHGRGRRLRFWATPDAPGAAREALWRELLDAGVDHLNTDDLAGLARFLRSS
ncbi:phosphatidylinositol-specific phospholipase C/glycerophosphodiester phosphodiesterase family protein [Streptomyces sp. NPDC057638]|uniref:phosphatidylinositol-specific phospholipase C/glycerophosphodiester phosphodiesterase family protein n=1 Tax=Streptomyces sp. NPDC057638 TaxID=3346190 RepID=UPI0036CBDFDD